MSKWEKLLKKRSSLSKELRFEELCKVLENYGDQLHAPREEAVTIHFEKGMSADNYSKT